MPAKVAKLEKRVPIFGELGATGLAHYAGFIQDEWWKDLRGTTQRQKLYREIRDQSGVIGAAFAAIINLLRRTPINVSAAGDMPGDEEARQFVQECFDDLGAGGWGSHIEQALSALEQGWSLCELVYKYRRGDNADTDKASKYTDGKIGWARLSFRAQESLYRWKFDGGQAVAFEQRPAPDFQIREIPAEKYLLFRAEEHRESPEGRSALRNCVLSWKFVKRIQEIEAIGVERDLVGYPVAWVPPEYLDTGAGSAVSSNLATFKDMIVNIRRDDQEGAVMPLEYDERGNKRFDLTLLSTGGARQFDLSAIVQRYEQRMLMTFLADFLLLGHEKVGSFSLSSDKTDMFAVAIAAHLQRVLDVWNRFAIPRLLRLNGMNAQAAPFLTHGDIETQPLGELADALSKLAAGGFVMPTTELEAHLLGLANLPVSAEAEEQSVEVE